MDITHLLLVIKDKNDLYSLYMPFIINGGLFVPTTDEYEMGQEIVLKIKLLDEITETVISGKIIWKTPIHPQNFKIPGFGIQFNKDDNQGCLIKIENYLADFKQSSIPTNTM